MIENKGMSDATSAIVIRNVLAGDRGLIDWLHDRAQSNGADAFTPLAAITADDNALYANQHDSVVRIGTAEYHRGRVNVRQYMSTYVPARLMSRPGSSWGALRAIVNGEDLTGSMEDVRENRAVLVDGVIVNAEWNMADRSRVDMPMFDNRSLTDDDPDDDAATDIRILEPHRMGDTFGGGGAMTIVTEMVLPFTVPSTIITRDTRTTKWFLGKLSKDGHGLRRVDVGQFAGDGRMGVYVVNGAQDLQAFAVAEPALMERVYGLLKEDKHASVLIAGNRITLSTVVTGIQTHGKFDKYATIMESSLRFMLDSADVLRLSAKPTSEYPPDVDAMLDAWSAAGDRVLNVLTLGGFGSDLSMKPGDAMLGSVKRGNRVFPPIGGKPSWRAADESTGKVVDLGELVQTTKGKIIVIGVVLAVVLLILI
jgi:hypothetical protein